MLELIDWRPRVSTAMDAGDNEIVSEVDYVEKSTKFIWKIRNFSACPVSFDESIRSDDFTFKGCKFHLCAYYSQANIHGPWDTYLTLHVNHQKPLERLVCAISAMDVDKEEYISERQCFQILPGSTCSDKIQLNKKSAILVHLVKGDSITIICEMMIRRVEQKLGIRSGVSCCRHESLYRDLSKFYTTMSDPDLELVVENQLIKAHSSLLSARCPGIAAMLHQDPEEHPTRTITISDVKAPIIKHLLSFVYTGEISEITKISSDMLVELYTAADNYCMAELKDMCVDAAVTSWSEESIKQFLENHASLVVNRDNFLELITLFFAHKTESIGSDIYNDLRKIFPSLSDKVLREIMKQ